MTVIQVAVVTLADVRSHMACDEPTAITAAPGKQEREAAPVSPKPHQGLAGQPHALGRPLIGNQIA
jgi:hypothetical protein